MSGLSIPPILLLANVHPMHAGRSGYTVLADYVPNAELITAPRRDPTAFWPLLGARLARRLSFSRWYLGGSAVLEFKARKRMSDFEGIVHSLWADHDLGYLDLMLDRRRQKFCATFHNCPDTFPETLRFPSRLRRFDALILMSETQRPFFERAGVRPERLHVVLHGVDVAHYRPASFEGPFSVLSVGGYRRNFPLVREVAARLPGIPFRIVAPPAYQTLFQGLANVVFRSGVSDHELLAEYQKAGCLLHTAENATANNALLEGMACGLPVVAEEIGGIPEYVTNECATLCPPMQADALVRAIRTLAESTETANSMSRAARARAEALRWENVALRMEEIYGSLWTAGFHRKKDNVRTGFRAVADRRDGCTP